MANNIIDKIQISGQSYDVKDSSAATVVELTQQEYNDLPSSAKTGNTLFVITDAQAGDLTQYWTSAQTQSAINQATSGKQETLVSGTNIKTINNESILGSGNIDIQGGGGGVNVVQTTGTSTTDVMSQDAVTTVINTVSGAIPSTYVSAIASDNDQNYERFYRFSTPSNFNYFILNNARINNKAILSTSWGGFDTNFSLVETSAITTSITSSSTDAQVPSAKAVNDKLGGLSLVKLTQAQYDALATKDNSTLYVIVN